MKKNILLSSFACAFAFVSSASAATIAATGIIDGAGGDTLVLGTAGNKLATGIASTGYFTITDSAVAGFAATYQADPSNSAAKSSLVSAFVGLSNDNFVAGAMNTFSAVVPGGYVSSVDLGLLGLSYAGLNKVLYTFFGDGANLGASAGIGLALHTGVTLDRDDNVAAPDSNDAGLNNPYQSLIRGAINTTIYDATALGGGAETNAAAFQLVGIPEPSAALLGALGALGLLRRRRN
jgi:hypothetical protein